MRLTDPGRAQDDAEVPIGLRQRKQAQTRAELKAAADRLFDRYGFDHVTVEDICAEVDISARTFFRYFRSKDEILFQTVEARFEEVTAQLAGRPRREPAFKALASVLQDVLGRPEYEHDTARLHTQILGSPELMRASLAGYRRFQDHLVELVADRPPCNGDRRQARLLVGVALVALQTAVEEWGEDRTQPLRSVIADTLSRVSGVSASMSKASPAGFSGD